MSRISFRLDPPAGGPGNMAADLALLGLARDGQIACRVYSWDGPWVTLGRFQRPERDVVPGFENWVKRPTGGKAVLHGHDLTVGMALPIPSDPRNVGEAQTLALTPILAALNACGRKVRLGAALGQPSPRTADCFAVKAGCDVISQPTGSKVCGCAMLIQDKTLLLQASIPYTSPLMSPANAIMGALDYATETWNHADFAEALRDALDTCYRSGKDRMIRPDTEQAR